MGAQDLSQKLILPKLKNVSSEYDRLNGWNSTLQAAWYIHISLVHRVVAQNLRKVVRACYIFDPHERQVGDSPRLGEE